MKRIFLIAACFLLLTGCCKSKSSKKEIQETESAKACTSITTDEFRRLVANTSKPEWRFLGDKPTIVDFYADWCGPCRMIAPTVEKIAQKYSNDINVYKVNIDNEPELARAFDISSIPTILFIPMNGEPIREVGITTMAGFERNIKKYFNIEK